MTQDEKEKFSLMEESIGTIKTDIHEIKSALLGNPLSGETGIAGKQIITLAKIELLETRIKRLEEEKIKNGVYIKAMAWLTTIVGAGIITYFGNLIINKK